MNTKTPSALNQNIKNLFMDKAYKSYIETDKTMIHIYKIFKNNMSCLY